MSSKSFQNIALVGGALVLGGAALFFLSPPPAPPTAELDRRPAAAVTSGRGSTALPENSDSVPTSAAATREPATDTARYPAPTAARLRVLDEVLRSRNDNDPRLDTEFRNLSSADKAALRAHYTELKAEDRNGRGTVVFLLGRELSEPADVAFLAEVLREKPCLSLADCSTDPRSGGDPHAESGMGTTLAYPQHVALASFERTLREHPERLKDPAFLEEVRRAVREGRASPVPAIARKAEDLASRLPG